MSIRIRRQRRRCGACIVLACAVLVVAFTEPAGGAGAVPSTPANVTITSGPAAGQVVLSWHAPVSSGASPITTYGFAKSIDGGVTFGSESVFHSNALTQSSATFAGLACSTRANGKGCAYRVFAHNSVGRSGASVSSAPAWVVPGAPTNFAGARVDASYSAAQLTWVKPTINGGFKQVLYHVLLSDDGGPFNEVKVLNLASITTDLSTTAPCHGAYTCKYRVFTSNPQGSGPASPTTITVTVAPSVPVGMKVTNVGVNLATGVSRLRVAWLRPNDGLRVASYELEPCTLPPDVTTGCSKGDDTVWGASTTVAPALVTAPPTPQTLSTQCSAGLGSCYYRVRGTNTRGGIGRWQVANLRPTPPFDLSTTATGAHSFKINFRNPLDTNGASTGHLTVFTCAGDCTNAANWSGTKVKYFFGLDGVRRTTPGIACPSSLDQCQARMQFTTEPVIPADGSTSLVTGIVTGDNGHLAITSPADQSIGTNSRPTFAGTCTAGEGTVHVAVDGAESTTAGCDAGGTWTAAPAMALADGTHTAIATQDGTDLTSSPVHFTVDTTAPTVGLTNPADGATVIGAGATIAGTCTTGDSVVEVDVTASGNVVAKGFPACNAGTFTVTLPLGSGSYQLQAHQSDAAGNIGYSSIRAFRLITALPPSLATEQLTTPSFTVTVQCDEAGTSSLSFHAHGAAIGPYPGTFTEDVVATVGPQTPSPTNTTWPNGPTTDYHGTFTIVSGTTTITGTDQFVSARTGACSTFQDVDFGSFIGSGYAHQAGADTSYAATIVTPDGTFGQTGATSANSYDIDIHDSSDGHTVSSPYTFTDNIGTSNPVTVS